MNIFLHRIEWIIEWIKTCDIHKKNEKIVKDLAQKKV